MTENLTEDRTENPTEDTRGQVISVVRKGQGLTLETAKKVGKALSAAKATLPGSRLAGKLPQARRAMWAATTAGRILLFGGYTDRFCSDILVLENGTVSHFGDLPEPVADAGVRPANRRRVAALVCGGRLAGRSLAGIVAFARDCASLDRDLAGNRNPGGDRDRAPQGNADPRS